MAKWPLVLAIVAFVAGSVGSDARASIGAWVELDLSVHAYGVPGTGVLTIDPDSGRFVRQFSAGAASESEGWDGKHAWRADATGMPRVQSDPGEIAEIRGWSRALTAALLHGTAHATTASSQDQVTISFSGFRASRGVDVPSTIEASSLSNGSWRATVRQVNFLRSSSAKDAFSPPNPPNDFALSGVTRVPMNLDGGSPIVTVAVNGQPMRMYLDSGGQNVLVESAARHAHLNVVGQGTVGGGGGTAPTRFAMVRTVTVGRATMFNQPYLILPDSALTFPGEKHPIDGVIGYELFARFAAKIDTVRRTLSLSRHANDLAANDRVVPMGLIDRQPEVNGYIDALTGLLTLDTGSSFTAQIAASVVKAHDLVRAMHAHISAGGAGVGGQYQVFLVRGRTMALGDERVSGPLVSLLTKAGVWNGPDTPIANVGFAMLRRWILVLDYPDSQIRLLPGGDPSGNIVHDRSGIVLATNGRELVAETVLGGSPAWDAGVRSGDTISSIDGKAVTDGDLSRARTLFRGKPGTTIRVTIDGRRTTSIVLQAYL